MSQDTTISKWSYQEFLACKSFFTDNNNCWYFSSRDCLDNCYCFVPPVDGQRFALSDIFSKGKTVSKKLTGLQQNGHFYADRNWFYELHLVGNLCCRPSSSLMTKAPLGVWDSAFISWLWWVRYVTGKWSSCIVGLLEGHILIINLAWGIGMWENWKEPYWLHWATDGCHFCFSIKCGAVQQLYLRLIHPLPKGVTSRDKAALTGEIRIRASHGSTQLTESLRFFSVSVLDKKNCIHTLCLAAVWTFVLAVSNSGHYVSLFHTHYLSPSHSLSTPHIPSNHVHAIGGR